MRYFRSYPLFLQALLFLLMVFTMMGFGSSMMLAFLPRLTPYTYQQLSNVTEQSPMPLINAAVVVQGFLSVFIFLVPALVFAYLAHPQPGQYLGLRAPGKKIQVLWVLLLIAGAMPMLQLLEGLIGQINFGAKIKADQAANDHMMGAFLTMPTFAAFCRAFLVMAIIPAVGEELFFRGIIMRFARKRTRNISLSVFFTAAVFAYVHSNIYGLLSIFLAGVLLAVIYYLTGSLWCSIMAHLFFNGSQVILAYLYSSNAVVKAYLESSSVPVILIVAGAGIFTLSLFQLLKNKTPLPAGWTDDFGPDGPSEGDWDFMKNNRGKL